MIGGVSAVGGAGSYYDMMQGTAAAYGGSQSGIAGVKDAAGAGGVTEGECKTCAERKYQDGSNDAGVSFQSPTHISPEMSASAVMSHEMEHVTREQGKAESEGREVLSQSVKLHSAVCPECGRSYIAGGVTTTTTGEVKQNERVSEPGKGENIDKIA